MTTPTQPAQSVYSPPTANSSTQYNEMKYQQASRTNEIQQHCNLTDRQGA